MIAKHEIQTSEFVVVVLLLLLLSLNVFVPTSAHPFITLSSKPGMTFLEAHQTGACRFAALSRAKVD